MLARLTIAALVISMTASRANENGVLVVTELAKLYSYTEQCKLPLHKAKTREAARLVGLGLGWDRQAFLREWNKRTISATIDVHVMEDSICANARLTVSKTPLQTIQLISE